MRERGLAEEALLSETATPLGDDEDPLLSVGSQ